GGAVGTPRREELEQHRLAAQVVERDGDAGGRSEPEGRRGRADREQVARDRRRGGGGGCALDPPRARLARGPVVEGLGRPEERRRRAPVGAGDRHDARRRGRRAREDDREDDGERERSGEREREPAARAARERPPPHGHRRLSTSRAPTPSAQRAATAATITIRSRQCEGSEPPAAESVRPRRLASARTASMAAATRSSPLALAGLGSAATAAASPGGTPPRS